MDAARRRAARKTVEFAYPDTLVGTDSHTTMVNGLAVLGWGVGGIEAEAAMLGQPISMLLPEVIGFKLTGELREGVTATDLVLTVTQMLRKKGVVGKFVEFYGPGLNAMSLADRATIANMAPEYGATCGFFPVDAQAIGYLKTSGRKPRASRWSRHTPRRRACTARGSTPDPFHRYAGARSRRGRALARRPKRPQDRVVLTGPRQTSRRRCRASSRRRDAPRERYKVAGTNFDLGHGDVVIAAITSCTNTSNPSVMIAAGLLARNAVAKGLTVKPWVKTSLAPGSQVVAEYLEGSRPAEVARQARLQPRRLWLHDLHRQFRPAAREISATIAKHDLVAAAVLSGNRNFEGRVNPHVRANYLASPPLVVAYALAGSMNVDLTKEPLGHDKEGKPVYLNDIWPTSQEIADLVEATITANVQDAIRQRVRRRRNWRKVKVAGRPDLRLGHGLDLCAEPALFRGHDDEAEAGRRHRRARILALFVDSITTDHISPAGSIKAEEPGRPISHRASGPPGRLQPYGTRRGNHEVMMRGTSPISASRTRW